MLSTAVTHFLDRVRARFGLVVDVLDDSLRPLYAEADTDLRRASAESGDVRERLMQCLATGRSDAVVIGTTTFQVASLSLPNGSTPRPALIAVAATGPRADAGPGVFAEFLGSMIEAAMADSESLADERDRSNRLLAMLRFFRHLAEIPSEAELARVLVQAAAVWFDVDARVYRRDLVGGFDLYASLPGVSIDQSASRLDPVALGDFGEPRRAPRIPGWSLGGDDDVLLVPIGADATPEWLLALIGHIPEDAEAHLSVLSPIAGAQLELVRVRRRERARFEGILTQSEDAPQQVLRQVLRELVRNADAAGAALTIDRAGLMHRIISVGAVPAELPETRSQSGAVFLPQRFTCTFPIAADTAAILELTAAPDRPFGRHTEAVTRACLDVLQIWLAGVQSSLVGALAPPAPHEDTMSRAFLARIEEELERAKRFDLRLSLVLIDVRLHGAGREKTDRLQETVRRELRGSDVLGPIGDSRLAALLTHTDWSGSVTVVERLRQRLARAAAQMGLAEVSVGHAAFSPECRTAEMLVTMATREAAPLSAVQSGY